ncbi:2-alkenal reductase (NADP(+)-dependent) [Dendrobium catenatum]|uniref:2-alkenal reductase (NADP(+)-dependent) n=1 Tax=Dendrobium catenatum TaxID=906689 RepID=UPI0009F473F9|nr:2-alkenal reductase (NADP(+)-dependent) [Dendrobium catenatum]XP_020685815.1 2-alkenal reductase (NADP(+)-dependent) [Dendrobium catenatum]XP_020685818.1 2-alkenal reductase (NADP(+)-dependent) [Dendrobium catenatum]XP_028553724.1 2-alkenal reductase (NADP(+)-dependent) [Dendrobium catenatum]
MNVENRYVTIKHPIEGKPLMSDFEVRTEQLTLEIQKGSKDVIVKNIFVSIDPYQLNRMKAESASQKASILSSCISPGQKIDAHGLGRVVESGNDKWKKGDLITGFLGWEEYSLVKPWPEPNKIEAVDQFPLSCYLSVLGNSGLTAYAGLFHICKPKKGDKVFVSAAAGSVGNLVGQYAKLAGCYVVGCAGSKKKVDLLKEKLGFDDVFNYKEEPELKSALRRYFPDGIDIYFDNVGGEMLEVAIANMNAFGRVAACGAISEYTDKKKQARIDMMDVIYKRITISGYLASDYIHAYPDFVSMTSEHLSHGRMHAVEDISHGIENVPSALVELFEGVNIGKKLVQVSEI